MVATDQYERAGFTLRAVGELRLRPLSQQPQGGIPGEGAEADDDLRVEYLQFAGGVREAGVALVWGRSVLGRGAPDGCRDPEPRKAQPVVLAPRDRPVGETR